MLSVPHTAGMCERHSLSRHPRKLLREYGESQRNGSPLDACYRQLGVVVRHLLIDAQGRRRSSTGEPVDRHPFEDCVPLAPSTPPISLKRTFVVFPWVRVRPGHELLVDPRKKADGGIRERVTQSLWFCRLFVGIPGSLRPELLSPRPAFLFLRCIRSDKVSEIKPWGLGNRRRQRPLEEEESDNYSLRA